MPPTLALILTLGFIAFLFRRDFREKPDVTWAIWLPILWLLIIASIPVTQWLVIVGLPMLGAVSAEEGSPVDALVFFALIASALYVLSKRRVDLAVVIRGNPWLALFLLYCFLAIFWSDVPFTSFKRWIKILGHPIMILIIFTEPDPREALVGLIKRCAFILFPISILWMKYYPALGRKSDEWGMMTNVGIAGGKNELGAICLLFGIFLFWRCLQIWRTQKSAARRNELRVLAILLLMIAYNLWKAHSGTSTGCFLLAAAVILGLGIRCVDKRMIGYYAVAVCIVAVAAQLTFDLYGTIVSLSGHESTIEGRGRLWQVLLETDRNPIFGAGYESYWLGDRLQTIWAMPEFRWHPTQAHNGYLETYLNLGIIGLFILIGVILVTFRKCVQDLVRDFEWGRVAMGCLVAIVAHNWTEAGFKGLSTVLFFFYLIALNYPGRRLLFSSDSLEDDKSFREPELAYAARAAA
ncbi:MAG: O-antigen ligase family protein [Chthoniobacterales bacterium]|nr:O-antigen ligase family protein [Chthoniobacterales bacterium]